MSSAAPLSSYISVRGRFVRSAHLERDYRKLTPGAYHLTETAYQVLKAVQIAIDQPSQRAITVTGPYGAGKSAFCLQLASLLERRYQEMDVHVALQKLDPRLHQALSENRFIPILIVGARQSLARVLLAGLIQSLERGSYTTLLTRLWAEARETMEHPDPTGRMVADLFRLAARLATLEGAQGLLLILDEMGKCFEYAALYPKQGDIFVLQELAEAAARSGDAPLLIVGVMHQNVEAYAHKLGRTYQSEWAKVSERFRQITFFPSDGERIDLLGRALKQDPRLRLTDGFQSIIRKCLGRDLAQAAIKGTFEAKAHAAYPLHPITLLALPGIFRRTGQSHRSMFSFLSGEEPHALGRFLRETPFDDSKPPLFMLDALFEYTGESLAAGWGGSLLARAWAEAIDIVGRAANVSADARRILRCIALLGILRDPRLHADAGTLELALTDSAGRHPDVAGALADLQERKLVAYSRTRGRYRLWEGGDVDVEDELAKAKTTLPLGTTLHVATQICPPPRLIARRHSYRTGTVRTFQVHPCSAARLEAVIAEAGDQLTIVLCLAESPEEEERAAHIARAVRKPNLMIAVAEETETLRDTSADVAAAHRVAKENRELPGDAAARRELTARRFEAETAFLAEWERLFGTREGAASWFHAQSREEFTSPKEFSVFLSIMADRTYPSAPTVRNELINRRTLSSAAAAGRRTLIAAMLERGDSPRLGIKAAPPELSMYECLLRATGLHREILPGQWVWSGPFEADASNLVPAWQALSSQLFCDPPAPQPVSALCAALGAPPFGLTEGVLPVLLCAFLLAHDRETTLYREGTFIPSPTIADWEVLLRRPELFQVSGCRIVGDRAAVIERLARGLNTETGLTPVVRGLIKMVRGLPEYAWKTRKLPLHVLEMREAFDKAKSPERLLFYDLPRAVGVTLLADQEVDADNVDLFFESLNTALQTWSQAQPTAVATARDALLDACAQPVGEEGFTSLRQRAAVLEHQVLQPNLLPLLRRAAAPGDNHAVLESVIALVAGRPPRSWSDMDAERFPSQARVIGNLFRQANESATQPLVPVLDEDEARSRDSLVRNLKATLDPQTPNHVVRAALLALMQELSAVEPGT